MLSCISVNKQLIHYLRINILSGVAFIVVVYTNSAYVHFNKHFEAKLENTKTLVI